MRSLKDDLSAIIETEIKSERRYRLCAEALRTVFQSHGALGELANGLERPELALRLCTKSKSDPKENELKKEARCKCESVCEMCVF